MPGCPHDEAVTRLVKDIYYGDGKDNPPVMTRLDRIEKVLESLNKLWWLLLAAVVSPIATELISYLGRK